MFNGYGDLGNYGAPRLLAHMLGVEYKKLDEVSLGGDDNVYVNGGSGYLVGTSEVLTTTFEVRRHLAQHADLYETERTMSHVA